MKEKMLYFLMGMLVSGIIAIGIFMVTGRNNNGRQMPNGANEGFRRTGIPPENLEGAEMIVQEDGSVIYAMPNGGTRVRVEENQENQDN